MRASLGARPRAKSFREPSELTPRSRDVRIERRLVPVCLAPRLRPAGDMVWAVFPAGQRHQRAGLSNGVTEGVHDRIHPPTTHPKADSLTCTISTPPSVTP